jgi:hypothetical protein
MKMKVKATQFLTIRWLTLTVAVLILGLACTCPALTEPANMEPSPETETATTQIAPTPTSKPTPTPAPDTLIVRSFPPGKKVYVVPEKATQGILGSANLTAEEYFVGHTPLEVSIESGTYRVTIEHEPAANLLDDGTDNILFQMTEGDENGWLQMAKVYDVTKAPDHQAIVTALIWPKEQSAEEFIATLPEQELFEVSMESFEPVLQRHHIPREDWDTLLTMICRTGKAVWYGKDHSDHLFIYFVAPDKIETRWGGIATP